MAISLNFFQRRNLEEKIVGGVLFCCKANSGLSFNFVFTFVLQQLEATRLALRPRRRVKRKMFLPTDILAKMLRHRKKDTWATFDGDLDWIENLPGLKKAGGPGLPPTSKTLVSVLAPAAAAAPRSRVQDIRTHPCSTVSTSQVKAVFA